MLSDYNHKYYGGEIPAMPNNSLTYTRALRFLFGARYHEVLLAKYVPALKLALKPEDTDTIHANIVDLS